METYYLDTIIFFFKSQKDLDFVAITDVLDIIDDNEIPEIAKRDMIFDTLRNYGLNEVSYRHGKFSPACDRSPVEFYYDRIHTDMFYPRQSIEFPVLNGSCGVKIPLN
jgi:hypothetical protein